MNRSNPFKGCATAVKVITFFVLVLLYMLVSVPNALAHKVLLFAYVEGDMVVVNGGFSDGTFCNDAKLEVFDPSGKKILEGRTDKNGVFSFAPPQRTDLKMVLDAGMGHRAEYTMPAEELPEIAASKNGKAVDQAIKPPETTSPQKANTVATPIIARDQASPEAIAQIDAKKIEAIVDRVVKERLRPLTQLIAKSQQKKGVSLTDVIGGIGYILGLMGIAMYVRYRKSSKP